jgi:hypothetical protein
MNWRFNICCTILRAPIQYFSPSHHLNENTKKPGRPCRVLSILIVINPNGDIVCDFMPNDSVDPNC